MFVVAWLLSGRLQSALPYWLPFAILLATEAEFVLRGWRENRHRELLAEDPTAERRHPGPDDADLGWVEELNEEGEPVLRPAPPRLRRTMRGRLLAVAGVCLAVVLFFVTLQVDRSASWSSLPAANRARAETRFSDEAGVIAGRNVTVRCDEAYAFTGVGSDAAGVAFPRSATAYLEPGICRSLYRVAFERKTGTRDAVAWAVTVLAHEATHLRGERGEAKTECFALQEGVALGVRLGLSPRTARDLMRSQLARDLSDASVQRVNYRLPPGCRNGGSLDLRPGDPSFP